MQSSLAKIVATLLAGVAVVAGASYAQDVLSGGGSPPPAPPDQACDSDGVTVGYDIGYSSTLPGFAVRAVRVLGIDPACDGAQLYVGLDDGGGSPLPNAEATTTVAGGSVRLPLGADVSAAAVRRVSVSVAGWFQANVSPPPGELPPETTTTPAPLLLAPAFCPTVSGAVTVVGRPAECGAVAAAPTARTRPSPVASWQANVFSEPVKVTLTYPDPVALPLLKLATGGTIVQLAITVAATGDAITAWSGVIAIDFPAQDGPFVSAYSEDGVTWQTISQLTAPDLPAGQRDGYFVNADRTVTVYTRHATFYALAPPPGPIRLTHAKLLPTGAVRFTWTPSAAGLGVSTYELRRNGRVLATVPGTRTVALLDRLGPTRSTLQVIAVDPLGNRSPASKPVAIRVPLLVGAQLDRGLPLRARVRVTAPARVRVLVLDSRGRRLALRDGLRELRLSRRAAGLVRLELRVPRSELRSGRRYRVVVIASGSGLSDRAELRFRG